MSESPEPEATESGSPSASGAPFSVALKYAPWIIIFLFFVFGAATIMDFPPVHYLGDEIGMMTTGADFVEGLLGGETPNYVTPRLYYTALWGVGKVLGVGVAQFRLFSLFASLGVLGLVFLLGRELGGRGAGLLAMLVVTSDYTFAWNSRLIRPEMLTILFVLGSFTALVLASGRLKARMLVFISALLVSLSINVHPNNLQYVVVILFMYPILFRNKFLSMDTLLFAAGIFSGILFWFIWSYIPRVGGVAEQAGMAESIIKMYPFPVLNENFLALFARAAKSFYKDYITIYLNMADSTFLNHISFRYYAVVITLAIIAGLAGKNRLRVLMLVGFPVSGLFLNYFLTNKFGYWHMVEVHPYLALAAAIGVTSFSGRFKSKYIRIALIAAFIFALPLVGYWDQAKSVSSFSSRHDYSRLLEKVSAPVPEAAGLVMGQAP